MKKTLCSILLTILSVCFGYSQITVTGVVKDESEELLPGAPVHVKGTSKAVITDAKGEFSIQVNNPDTTVLTASYIGMEDIEIPLNGKTKGIVIALKVNAKMLQEAVVVAVGYGNVRRRDLTGAISSLSPDVIKDLPVSNIQEAMAGRLAGVTVTVADGSPDADIAIRVRGGTSITQDNSPLYIVDGFKVPDISNIAPRDIESIDVLKDAASTAIYGAEGANGVIIVTTKSGQKGSIRVSFNTFYGTKKTYNLPKGLSPYEYVYYQREIDPDPSSTSGFSKYYGNWSDVDIYKSYSGDDWVGKLFNTPTTQQNQNLSLSGGSDIVRFNLSLTHDDQGYIMKSSHYTKNNLLFKITGNISKNISVDFTNRLSYITILGPNVATGKLLSNCIKFPSAKTLTQMDDLDLYDSADGINLESISTTDNPTASIVNDHKKQVKFDNANNAGITWKIFNCLSYRGQVTYADYRNTTNEIWTNGTAVSKTYEGLPVADHTGVEGSRWNISNSLSLKCNINSDNQLDVVLGQEAINESDETKIYYESTNYPASMTADQILADWSEGTIASVYTTISEPVRTYSYFGRVNYALKSRYILSMTGRSDSKNVFASGSRTGFFPGAAFAWRMSDESFLKNNKYISNLKLRLSYGEVGNANVSSNWRQMWAVNTTATQQAYFDETSSSVIQTSTTMANDKLKWESTTSGNVGLDFGLFNNFINGTVEYYKSTTKNLILKASIPASSGYTYQYQNIGQVSNHGVEITLNSNLISKKDFTLSANFNITFNRNRVDKYTGASSLVTSDANYSITNPQDYIVQEGKPLGQMYGYVLDGAYTFDDFYYSTNNSKWVLRQGVTSDYELIGSGSNYYGPGFIKLKDLDGDGKITSADKTVIGCAQPKHTGGFGFNVKWKGFDFSSLFNWSYGNQIYNANKMAWNTYSGTKKYINISSSFSLANRFTTIDPATGENIFSGKYANPALLEEINKNSTLWNPLINTTFPLSWCVEDGSFLRLGSMTLGYTLPSNISKKVSIQTLRVYVSAYNVFCLTKYSGQDPEVSTGTSPLTPGLDYSAYPKSRSFIFGANISF